MNAGEPLNEIEAEQMMKEADKDGDGTIDYEGTWHKLLFSCQEKRSFYLEACIKKIIFVWWYVSFFTLNWKQMHYKWGNSYVKSQCVIFTQVFSYTVYRLKPVGFGCWLLLSDWEGSFG